MPNEQDRRCIQADRADRHVIEQAAAQPRHGAIVAGYADLERKHVTFALALVLDEVARHLGDPGDDLRSRLVELSRDLLVAPEHR